MATRTTKQRQEANRLISEHNVRAAPKGLEAPAWNAILWRYIDLPKLVDMLASNALPLIRVDKFEDKWEGFLAPLSKNEYQGFFAKEQRDSDLERFQQGEQLRKFYYASCWHQSGIESDAMWKLYMSGNEGLAIRTTYQSLIYSLRKASQVFLIGNVRYKKPSAGLSMLLTCMTKREPFAHEKEVRVIWHDSDAEQAYRNKNPDSVLNSHAKPPVERVLCDFKQLIEEVYISPKAGAWFAPAVRDLLKKYKLKGVEVSQSVLSGEPPWPKRVG
jgi:hypothetical protein